MFLNTFMIAPVNDHSGFMFTVFILQNGASRTIMLPLNKSVWACINVAVSNSTNVPMLYPMNTSTTSLYVVVGGASFRMNSMTRRSCALSSALDAGGGPASIPYPG